MILMIVTVNAQPVNERHLTFTVTDSTLGYYWCEIGNVTGVSLRPTLPSLLSALLVAHK